MATKKVTRKGVAGNAPTKAVAKKKPAITKQSGSRATARVAPTRRPDPNERPSAGTVNCLTDQIMNVISQIEEYAANLRALDRQRHNGVGLKRQGFIEAALRLATNFPQYYPHWLDTQKFQDDLDLFNAVRSLVEACRSLEEKAWNINVEASDMVYTDALEYYSQVKDAARRRIDSAETLYAELYSFFKSHSSSRSGEPTEREIRRDMNALLKGRKDGKIVVENVSPKAVGGGKKLVDETFKSKIGVKETENEEIE